MTISPIQLLRGSTSRLLRVLLCVLLFGCAPLPPVGDADVPPAADDPDVPAAADDPDGRVAADDVDAGAEELDAVEHGRMEGALDQSAVVIRTVERFHHALSSGDSAAVLDLLAPGARIVEGGGVETREEYASHHLGADMDFLEGLEVEETRIQAWVEGDVAWAVTATDLSERVRDRDVSLRTAELAVLARYPEGWRIVAVHWSSRSLEGR